MQGDVVLTPAKGGGGRRVGQESLGCLTAALSAGQAVLPREECWFETPLEGRSDVALLHALTRPGAAPEVSPPLDL